MNTNLGSEKLRFCYEDWEQSSLLFGSLFGSQKYSMSARWSFTLMPSFINITPNDEP